MRSVGILEVKTKLSELLRSGEPIEITSHKRSVAVLYPKSASLSLAQVKRDITHKSVFIGTHDHCFMRVSAPGFSPIFVVIITDYCVKPSIRLTGRITPPIWVIMYDAVSPQGGGRRVSRCFAATRAH